MASSGVALGRGLRALSCCSTIFLRLFFSSGGSWGWCFFLVGSRYYIIFK